MLKLSLSIGKVLLNLEAKLTRLEAVNDKLAEVFEQGQDVQAAEQFQTVLDEESELIDDTITKISQLKLLKEELEKRRKESDNSTQSLVQRVTQVQEQINHWSQPPADRPIKAPQLDIPISVAPIIGSVIG